MLPPELYSDTMENARDAPTAEEVAAVAHGDRQAAEEALNAVRFDDEE